MKLQIIAYVYCIFFHDYSGHPPERVSDEDIVKNAFIPVAENKTMPLPCSVIELFSAHEELESFLYSLFIKRHDEESFRLPYLSESCVRWATMIREAYLKNRYQQLSHEKL